MRKNYLINLCDNDMLIVDRLRKEFYYKPKTRTGIYDRLTGVNDYIMTGIIYIHEVSSLTGKSKNE